MRDAATARMDDIAPTDPSAEPDDAGLVAAARAGDDAALERLVRRHYRAAFATALALLGTREDAEDVCHDALVRAAQRLAECRDPSRFRPWLMAIVRNTAHNARARGAVRRAAPLAEDTAASPVGTADRAERAELGLRLERALANLNPTQREVLLLHDLDGWSHADSAGAVGTSEGMSRQHLFKARRLLRKALGLNFLEELRP